MTSDRVYKYMGTNDQSSTPKRQYMTKDQKRQISENEDMTKRIPNKCASMGCPNQMMTFTSQYTNKTTTISCYCEEHN